jgi:hypothetical protein
VNEKASGGDSWISFYGVHRHDPVLTVTPDDLGYWASIGAGGAQLTSLVAYLRKKSADLVTNVADGTAQHIALVAADNPCGMATLESSSGGIGEPASTSIRCGLRVANPLTTYPLTVNLASAIT